MTLRCTPFVVAVMAITGLLARPVSAAGLDCGQPPTPHPEADAALARAITSPKRDRDSDGALAAAIRQLKGDGVRNALITDHAVAAYCPLVAKDDSLSPDRKQEDVRRFASDVTNMVYGALDPTNAETAIILSLPVKPALSEQIDAAAAKAGQTRDAWIEQAIKDKLTGG